MVFGVSLAIDRALMPRSRRQNREEERLHRQVADYLRVALGNEVMWFHVPNGGARSKAEAGIFKALGVMPGVFDLCFLWRPGDADNVKGSVGFIELKAPGKILSDPQKHFSYWLSYYSTPWTTCYRVEDVDRTLTEWGLPHLHISAPTIGDHRVDQTDDRGLGDLTRQRL